MKIQELIAKDQTKKAIEMLISNFLEGESSLYNQALIIQSRYSHLMKKKSSGVISNVEEILVKNQINESILDLSRLDIETLELKNTLNSLSSKNKLNKKILGLFTILICLLVFTLSLLIIKNKNDQVRIAAKVDYIKELESRAKLMNDEIHNLKDEFPQFIEFTNRYNQLQKELLSAIKDGSLSRSHNILSKIHKLPKEFNLNQISFSLEKEIQSLKVISNSIIKDKTNQKLRINELKKQKRSVNTIEMLVQEKDMDINFIQNVETIESKVIKKHIIKMNRNNIPSKTIQKIVDIPLIEIKNIIKAERKKKKKKKKKKFWKELFDKNN